MNNIEYPTSPSFGFLLLARKQLTKMMLDERGMAGLKSLISACIASGINTEDDILNEVSDITGLHSEPLVRLLLMERENIDWQKASDGTFIPLANDDDANLLN